LMELKVLPVSSPRLSPVMLIQNHKGSLPILQQNTPRCEINSRTVDHPILATQPL